MILGERIKRIRTFRGLTQRELGLKLGYEERNADVRVAQYESGYRVPKKDTLMEIAKILNVNYINFITEAPGCAEDIMQTFFWLDEDNRNTFHLFQLVRNPGKCNASDDKSVRYNDSDEWPAHTKKINFSTYTVRTLLTVLCDRLIRKSPFNLNLPFCEYVERSLRTFVNVYI